MTQCHGSPRVLGFFACSDWKELITWPQEENGGPLAFTKDGKSVYVQSSIGYDITRLLQVDCLCPAGALLSRPLCSNCNCALSWQRLSSPVCILCQHNPPAHLPGSTKSKLFCLLLWRKQGAFNVPVVQIDALTAEEQKVIAYSDKTDIGRVMLNEETRSASACTARRAPCFVLTLGTALPIAMHACW